MAGEKRGIGAKANRDEEPEELEEREPKRSIGRAKPAPKAPAPKEPMSGLKKAAGPAKVPPAARPAKSERQREHERDARHDEKHDRRGDAPSGAAGSKRRTEAATPPDESRKSAPGAGEETLGELADRASRRLGALFNEAKEKAGPTARKVGELLGEARDKAAPTARSAAESTKQLAVDLEGGFDEAFGKISAQARDLMSKGQHTRVRIKFRGRQLTELPIAVVAAAEAASLWWFGPLRLLLGHVVGKSVLDVEFVSNADAHVAEGRAQLADGELEKALAAFDKALAMDRRSAAAWLGRGVALKLRGDKPGAKESFEKAEQCDPHGESGREARRHLDNLAGK